MHAFPNLKRLYFDLMETPGWEDVQRLREEFAAQLLNQPWTSLDYVEGSVEAVYALAFPCKICHLDIDIHSYHGHPEFLFPTILDAARPTRVRLRSFG